MTYKVNFPPRAVNQREVLGRTSADILCRHCGAVVSYHRACLGEGGAGRGCEGCHLEAWVPGWLDADAEEFGGAEAALAFRTGQCPHCQRP